MSNPDNIPYLSFVMTSRNDDYGGNARRRMQVSIQDRLEQLERHRIESELILVEWNPPDDRPLLKEVLGWPEKLKFCTVRIIEVPPSIHKRYAFWDKTPMNVTVAINCGVRRARGRFVLPGNIDMIYSEELMAFIGAKSLKEDERYRIDRSDVDNDVLSYESLDEQLKFCKGHIIQSHQRGLPAGHEKLPHLHTNASGDFQLMSRHYWQLLRGYLEADIISAYGDGLLCFASYAAGMREIVLEEPLRLYHIDHGGKFNTRQMGSGLPLEKWLTLPFLTEKMNNFTLRVYRILLTTFGYKLKGSVNGIPTLHFAGYRKMARDIIDGKRSYILNDEDWGLGKDTLEEYVINVAEWDKN